MHNDARRKPIPAVAAPANSGSDPHWSMRQWLEEFMNAPRSGVRRYKVDGAPGMDTTRCK
ncbi:MAG TPA: hypothetical protein VHK90_17360 [Thermoanaerobaculia bacterium]|nr:hypothetical protein [Thermoanaerobaculia bacterium]